MWYLPFTMFRLLIIACVHSQNKNHCLLIATHCLPCSPQHATNKSVPLYEDPQLQANPAYGTAVKGNVVNEEENYEPYFQ